MPASLSASRRPRFGLRQRGAWAGLWMALVATAVVPGRQAGAQQQPAPTPSAGDTVRGVARADTARGPRRVRSGIAPRPGLEPPISPRRAFLTSLVVPGLGQSRLQRPSAGAGFFLVELGALALMRKSLGDLREAKRLRADSVAAAWPVNPETAEPLPRPPRETGAFGEELVRARRVHVEDWAAVLVFNHLIAGVEAYVAANLWDVPAQVSMRTTPAGTRAVVVAIAW
jgi:hypothetical protein